ncbi:MAG TPA: hypothetical protein VI566_09085 [Xanthomonadales bacterium]|nr:hypothetical protein [Xanthomonadales bacterium]
MSYFVQPTPSRLKYLILFLLFGLLLVVASSASAFNSNKWRLQCSGGANSAGVITLQFTPKGGEPIVTETPIKKGTSENGVAKALVKSLKAQLPKDAFHIERDDGEDVLVKKKWGAKSFDFKKVSITVKGVRINPQHE